MTEQEWLACTNLPNQMMGCLGDRPNERQLRLFACAMVRQVWHLLTDRRSQAVVEVAERFADGLASPVELDDARSEAEQASELLDRSPMGGYSPKAATAASLTGVVEDFNAVVFDAYIAVTCSRGHKTAGAMYRSQTDLLRDIFRNPFRPLPAIDPAWKAWNDGVVPRLAASVYEGRQLPQGTLDAGWLAILADALEEAGCADREMLEHCREPGLVHVRGCWVVDLILKKE